MKFQNRSEAGQMLATKLAAYARRTDVVVLALPRGGVPVASSVAETLGAPLDVFLVRKLGVPGYKGLAMGAIASGGVRVINNDLVQLFRIPDAVIEEVTVRERQELERREHLYRGTRLTSSVRGRTVILVDDGLATGLSMRAAAMALRAQQPARIVIAVPVAAAATCEEFRREVDEVVCAFTPEPFSAIGLWYEDFSQTTDDEVRDLLERAARDHLIAIRRSA
ncbi:MAG TPA: phosphoribosyltransferase family protein [Blastocatellia bacterium]|nr:phosphoribosyltransferase family protein [Blastocatellia bacterium]